jgi:uncharacterized protein YbjQ (UPF0145 family)
MNKKKYISRKKERKYKNKSLKKVILLKGGAWYSYFYPSFLFPKNNEEKPVENKTTDNKTAESTPSSSIEEEEIRKPDKPNKKTNKKLLKGKNKTLKNVRELYKIESDENRTSKEFFDNPNISTWCFDSPNYKPVGIVHVTSVVGVNILRGYSTTVKNVIGFKGSIDENMHQLRNEIYIEMENVMEKENIDKICNVGVAFTKDAGNLILSAFGTAMRKKTLEQ